MIHLSKNPPKIQKINPSFLIKAEEECTDSPFYYKDKYGDDCASYKTNNWCASWGHKESTKKDGVLPNEACCTCGGGTTSSGVAETSDPPPWEG